MHRSPSKGEMTARSSLRPGLERPHPWLPSTRTFQSTLTPPSLGRGARFRRRASGLVPGFVLDARLDGDARIVTFANGTVARELLVDCDDARRRLVYAGSASG